MSEARKTISTKDAVVQQTLNSNKASADVVSKKRLSQQKSKSSIPKNLRYDLENALVGLCDVWFEDIKPYLVSNNIKLHVHADVGGGDSEQAPGSPNCSHLDPGRSNRRQRPSVNYVDSFSTHRTALRAPCRRPTVPQLPLVVTEMPNAIQSPRRNKKKETVRKPRKRRKCEVQTQSRQPIPRLCRTNSLQPCSGALYSNTGLVIKIPVRNTTKFLQTKKKYQNVDASTQTEKSMKSVKKYHNKITDSSALSKFMGCPTTTTNLCTKQNKQPIDTSLFKEDLVDIIAEKYDKTLKVLYTSPRKQDRPSVMNLFSTSERRPKSRNNKIPPWK